MNVQTPTKIARNAPCPCGSGRKFKKCCGKEKHKMETPKLKNEFRDEVRDPYAGIPVGELVKRDQAVLLKELQFRFDVNQYNVHALVQTIEKAKSMGNALLASPKSPYRELVLNDLDRTIETNQKQLEAIKISHSMKITKLALEALLTEKPGHHNVEALYKEDEEPLKIKEGKRKEGYAPVDDEPDELADDPREAI